jgi:hypothetical protein
MQRRVVGIAIIICLMLIGYTAAGAEDAKSFPNLLGTWIDANRVILHVKGKTHAKCGLRVFKQEGPYFRATHFWELTDKKNPPHTVGGKRVHTAEEPILGVIGFDGKTIYMVEHNDWGMKFARLIEPNKMEVVYMEAGPGAAITRFYYTRKK